MPYTVFFRDEKRIVIADNFIGQQPTAHQDFLRAMTDALAASGTINDPRATKNSNGDWSVLVTDTNEDVYIYVLFTSHFEAEAKNETEVKRPSTNRELVIIDPAGPKDSVGGYHPGYWSIDHYASLMEDEKRRLFLEVVNQVENNIPSGFYSINNDGSLSIHASKQGAYTISVVCRAEWLYR